MTDQPADGAFWISYSDLAVGVLMVFVLITTVLLIDTMEQSLAADEAHKESLTAKERAESFETQLKEKTKEIEAIVGIRQSLVAELSREFAKQGHQIKVDPQTGALQLPSDIIFRQGDSRLSTRGEAWLTRFVPRYLGVLLSKKFSKYVRRIEVEGHASSEGPEIANLELSQARALSVTKFILSNTKTKLAQKDRKRLKQILTASGRGEYELVVGPKGEDRRASRRVVFKFRLTEEEAMKDIQRMLRSN